MAGNSTHPARSVTSKVALILLAVAKGTTPSLTEISRRTGLPLSTVHRLTIELWTSGLLTRQGDRYCLNPSLEAAFGRRLDDRSAQLLEDLASATGADARLGALSDGCIAYMQQPVQCRLRSAPPWPPTLPAHATALGKALLAFAPPASTGVVLAEGLTSYTPHTLGTAEQLSKTLAETRRVGVATSRWEHKPGLCAVALPVTGAGGAVIAAVELSIHGDPGDLRRLLPPLEVVARSLSHEFASSDVSRLVISRTHRLSNVTTDLSPFTPVPSNEGILGTSPRFVGKK